MHPHFSCSVDGSRALEFDLFAHDSVFPGLLVLDIFQKFSFPFGLLAKVMLLANAALRSQDPKTFKCGTHPATMLDLFAS